MKVDGRRTPLYERHVQRGARMVSFAGWAMPVYYEGILKEHEAVRTRVGLFDVSHMGRVWVRGRDAGTFLNAVLPARVSDLGPGKVRYALLCNEAGGIIDDLLVYGISEKTYLLVVNASRTVVDIAWLDEHAPSYASVEVTDGTQEGAMMALQGPASEVILSGLTSMDLAGLGYYRFVEGAIANRWSLVSRTGYTGEDGFEILCGAEEGTTIWAAILEAGAREGLVPAGLGARDTLRLEMGYPLYGNDIDEHTTPLEARLGWTVDWEKGDFVGRLALVRQREQGVRRQLMGLKAAGRVVPRREQALLDNNEKRIGVVTSGSFSPTLKKGIGLGYVEIGYARPGTKVWIDVRGKLQGAEVVKPPFVRSRVRQG